MSAVGPRRCDGWFTPTLSRSFEAHNLLLRQQIFSSAHFSFQAATTSTPFSTTFMCFHFAPILVCFLSVLLSASPRVRKGVGGTKRLQGPPRSDDTTTGEMQSIHANNQLAAEIQEFILFTHRSLEGRSWTPFSHFLLRGSIRATGRSTMPLAQ